MRWNRARPFQVWLRPGCLLLYRAGLLLVVMPETTLCRDPFVVQGAAAEAFGLGSQRKTNMVFHRRVRALAGNEYRANALELFAFRLFPFVLIQCCCDSRSKLLDAARQRQGILAGLCSRDPVKAREAFVFNTVKFWNENHWVGISETSFAHSLDSYAGIARRGSTAA